MDQAEDVGYPAHLLHFETFGTVTGGPRGEPFEAQVNELDTGKTVDLKVASDKTLLQTLREAGFDMTSFCEVGACGACRVTLCGGRAIHTGTGLPERDRPVAMLSCADRGLGKVKIELD